MGHFFLWYAVGLCLSLPLLPLLFSVFPERPDGGWPAGRLLALCLVALLQRLVVAAGAAPWSLTATVAVVSGLLAFGLLALWWQRHVFFQTLRTKLAAILAIELVFLAAFAFAAGVAAHAPAFADTERLMDFTLLKSIVQAERFPPADLWLSGHSLNYYWLGHQMAAIQGVPAAVPAAVSYHLALAQCFALLVQLACAVCWSQVGAWRSALLGAVLVGLAGTAHTAWWWLSGAETPFSLYDASRVIPHTITEFPLLSLLVGDLHAHFLMLPVLLLFALWLQAEPTGRAGRYGSLLMINALLLAMLLGNPWYLAAMLILFAVCRILRVTELPWWAPLPAMLMLPLLWPVQGVGGPALAPVAQADTSALPAFLLVWGIPLVLLPALLDPRRLRDAGSVELLWLLPALLLALHSVPASLCLVLAAALWRCGRAETAPWRALGVAGLILLALPELFYIVDPYAPPYQRLNTVFKFSCAASPLLMLAGARAALVALEAGRGRLRPLRAAMLMVPLSAAMVYPAFSLPQRLAKDTPVPLWDGIAALASRHPRDIELINWLAPRLQPAAVCLEAPGVSYQWSGRVAALTGCAAVLGWEQHERVWRGAAEEITRRREDVQRAYLTRDSDELRRILEHYSVDWIVVGETELNRFAQPLPLREASYLQPLYRRGAFAVYRVTTP